MIEADEAEDAGGQPLTDFCLCGTADVAAMTLHKASPRRSLLSNE